MKRASTVSLVVISGLLGLQARADVVPPEVAQCQGAAAGAACDAGKGTCTAGKCTRLDYANWNRDASAALPLVEYDCIRCVPKGTVTASGTATGTGATTPVTGTTTDTGATAPATATTTDIGATAPATATTTDIGVTAPATATTTDTGVTTPATATTTDIGVTAPATATTTGTGATVPATGTVTGTGATAPATGAGIGTASAADTSGTGGTAGAGGAGGKGGQGGDDERSDDSGCSMGGWAAARTLGPWLLAGLFGAAVMLLRRRRG